MYEIALQTEADSKIVDALMDEAFGLDRHARSVWNLRSGAPVAEMCFVLRDNGVAVGSLRFWEVMLGTHRILLLGPLAVQPDLRGKGYGKELVSSGLSYAKSFNWPVILVSGEVDYYPKFGFVPAAPYGIEWPGFIELERLQFFELEDGFLASLSGQHLPVCPVG